MSNSVRARRGMHGDTRAPMSVTLLRVVRKKKNKQW